MKIFTLRLLKIPCRHGLHVGIYLLFLLCTSLGSAQMPTGVIWDHQVGCEAKEVEAINFDVEAPENCIKVCQGSTVTYTLLGNADTWGKVVWHTVGGVIETTHANSGASITWTGEASGEIIIEIHTEEGEIITQTVCIEILPKPFVDFTVFPEEKLEILEVCEGEEVFFENLAHANGGSSLVFYEWYFEDTDTTSAEFEPSHVFSQSGTYFIELTVTNACNCSASRIIEVEVLSEGLQIECNTIMCEDEVDTYTVTNLHGEPIECEAYEWIAEGGDILSHNPQSAQVMWNDVDEDGFGYLTYEPLGCDVECALPVTIKVPVITNNANITGASNLCVGEQYRYSIPQWPTTEVEWKVAPSGMSILPSDQPNEIVLIATAPGTYQLEAIYTNTLKGCGGVAFKEITVDPLIHIEGPKNVCQGEGHPYTTNSGTYFEWEIKNPYGEINMHGGGTIDVPFDEPGIYTIQLVDVACVQPNPFTVWVNPIPETPEGIEGDLEVCQGQPTTYTIDPPAPPGAVAMWEIDNGLFTSSQSQEATGNQVSVIWSPNTAVPYELNVYFEKQGCKSNSISINPKPLQVDYTFEGAQTVCSSSYETYSVDYLEGDKYEWEILTPELGSISEYPQDHEVEVLWNNVSASTTGIVKLTITKCGVEHVKQYDVVINPTAVININAPTSVCRDEPVHFSIGGLTSWDTIAWDFGDGNTASTPNPTHTYTALNTNNINYPVTVTVTEPNGCVNTATVSVNVEVKPAPVAYFSPAQNYYFCDASELAANQPNLILVVDNNYGAPSQIEWYHNGIPIPSLPPLATSYTATQFGEYYAVISSGNDCSTTTSIIKVIDDDCGSSNDPGVTCNIAQPYPNIISINNTACGEVTFQASQNGSVTPNDFAWSVDGTLLTGQSITAASVSNLAGAGIHEVRYQVAYTGVDDNGNPCEYTLAHTESFVIPYEADLKYEVHCSGTGNGYDVTLYDASSFFASTPIQNINYFVGGVHQTASDDQATHTEHNLAPGLHTFKIEISGSGYPTCTAEIQIDLPALPTATINAPIAACAGAPVQFSATVNDPNVTYAWDFGDFASNSLPDPIRNFDNAQTFYDVNLTITNQFGCAVTTTHTIDMNGNDMKGNLTLNPQTTCEGNSISIVYAPNSGNVSPTTFYWNREIDGTVVGTQQTSVNNIHVTQPGTYILDGEDGSGCRQYDIARIKVEFLETPKANISGPREVCADEHFSLTAKPNASTNYTYTWKRNGQSMPQWDDEFLVEEQLSNTGLYTYEVTITTPAGCSETAPFTVEVFPQPDTPTVSIDVTECNPYQVDLSASVNEPGTYVWSDGQSGSDISVSHGGPYRVIFTNEKGCTSSKEIHVPHNPEAYIWTYPQGCYDLCELNINAHYITGPSAPFEWEWQIDQSTVQSGTGVMPQQHWSSDGHYQLALSNGTCEVVSPGFSWGLAEGCEECELEVNLEWAEPMVDANNNCYYIIHGTIINNGPSVSYSVDNISNTGVVIPGGGVLNTGNNNVMLEFYPPDNFGGGTLDFIVMGSSLEEPFACVYEVSIYFPPCPSGSAKPSAGTGTGLEQGYNLLPNPTTGRVQLTHQLKNSEANATTLYVYDLSGREVKKQVLSPGEEKTTIDLGEMANGTYLVMLRQQGKTLYYQQLILNK